MILNEPFKSEIHKGNYLEMKNKFLARRFKASCRSRAGESLPALGDQRSAAGSPPAPSGSAAGSGRGLCEGLVVTGGEQAPGSLVPGSFAVWCTGQGWLPGLLPVSGLGALPIPDACDAVGMLPRSLSGVLGV